jgi:hypothetical protein
MSEREVDSEPRDAYILHAEDTLERRPIEDLSGKLRLTRVGNLVTGYYWDAESAGWLPFASGTCREEDVNLSLYVWSHDHAFADQEVRVAFDNFVVNKGQRLGPTLPDLHGRWVQLRQRTRGAGENARSRVQGVFATQNKGGTAAGPSILRFYLSEDESLSPDDLLLQERVLRVLRPKRRLLTRLRKVLPSGVEARGSTSSR